MGTGYAAFWKAIADNRDWEQEERIAHSMYDPPNDWTVNPTGRADLAWNHYLRLRVWGHGATSALAAWCLQVARRDADEAERQDLFERCALPGFFPLNRCGFLRAKLFIDAFADQQPLARGTVLRIAADESLVAPIPGRRQWDALPQSDYLHTIDLLLLVGEVDEARAMLKAARGLRGRHVKELHAITRRIAADPDGMRHQPDAAAEYRRMFDLLRDPRYADSSRGHPSSFTQRLIMACMLQAFLEPGDGRYDLDRAVDMMWADPVS